MVSLSQIFKALPSIEIHINVYTDQLDFPIANDAQILCLDLIYFSDINIFQLCMYGHRRYVINYYYLLFIRKRIILR